MTGDPEGARSDFEAWANVIEGAGLGYAVTYEQAAAAERRAAPDCADVLRFDIWEDAGLVLIDRHVGYTMSRSRGSKRRRCKVRRRARLREVRHG